MASEIKVLKEVCDACGKTVYPQERVTADNRVWHKSCFRCLRCNNVLKLGSFAAMEGKFYCKVCFKKLFFSKGNYSEGFGKLTPQQEHDLKSGKIDQAPTPSGDPFPPGKEPAKVDSPKPEPVKEVHKPEPVKEAPKPEPKKEEPKKEEPARTLPSPPPKKEPEPPKKEEPKAEPPKPEPVKEEPKAEPPKPEPPKPEPVKEEPKVEPPKPEPVKEEPKHETPKAEPKKEETTPKIEVKAASSPSTDKGSGEKSNKCEVCTKTVYPMEEFRTNDTVFHKTCFRCKKCNSVLKLGNFASMENEFFCKVCFKKLFFSKGNYSDGFGKLTPQQEHDQKTGKTSSYAYAGSFKGVDKK